MGKLETTKDKAVAEFRNASDTEKKMLARLFGNEAFEENIMEKVRTVDELLSVAGLKYDDVVKEEDSPDEAAYKLIKLLAKTLNQGWEPNWTDDKQYKYYPWFDLSSGSGLRSDDYVYRYSTSGVGSPLCYKSKELALYVSTQFKNLYEDFFIIK